MALNAISHLLVFTAGLFLDVNTIFDSFFNPEDIPVPPPPVSIISATKTIKLTTDTAIPSLYERLQHGKGASELNNRLPVLLMVLIALSLLSISSVQYLTQKAAAASSTTEWRSRALTAEKEITGLTNDLQARAQEVTNLKNLLAAQQARDEEIDRLNQEFYARDEQFTDTKTKIGMIEQHVNSYAQQIQNLQHVNRQELESRDQLISTLEDQKLNLARQLDCTTMKVINVCKDADAPSSTTESRSRKRSKSEPAPLSPLDCVDAARLSHPTNIATAHDEALEDGSSIADDDSEISKPRSTLEARSEPFTPGLSAGMALLPDDVADDGEGLEDEGGEGNGAAENSQPTDGGKKKRRRGKRGKGGKNKKEADAAAERVREFLRPPAGAPREPKAMRH